MIASMLRTMDEVDHPFKEILVYTPEPLSADVTLPAVAHNVVLRTALPPGLWEQIVLPRAHNRDHLLLCPSYVVPLSGKSRILLIHHGSYEGYPQAFGWWQRNRARAIYTLSAMRATVISTVSEHSKRDIVRFYGVHPDKVHVIPEGVDTRIFRPLGDPDGAARWRRKRLGSDVPFVMYVGKPTKRRNVPALIRAFGALKEATGIPHKLLLVGTDLPGAPYASTIAELELESEVVTWGYASHDEMVAAYNAAAALAYPSSYEGFGMPVLEAMACGTPALALDNTAFPEFASGVALLLESADIGALRDGLHHVLTDAQWRERATREGPARAAAYDWRGITRQYIELMVRTMS